MQLVTLKQFAEDRKVTYESVRRLVSKYAEELGGHVILKDGVRYLDEEACAFLRDRRRASPVVVRIESHDEELESLREDVESLRAKLAEAQTEIMGLQKARIEDSQKILALTEETKMAIEDRTARKYAEDQVKALEQQRDADQEELARLRSEVGSFERSWFGLYRKKKS